MAEILIIEDDDQVRRMLAETVTREGHVADEAIDGLEGTQKCAQKSYDLVIADILTPRKEGLETIRELRRDYPDIKIIAISGGGRVGPAMYLQTAKVFGAHRIFEKPIDREELLRTIDQLLSEDASGDDGNGAREA